MMSRSIPLLPLTLPHPLLFEMNVSTIPLPKRETRVRGVANATKAKGGQQAERPG